MGLVVLKNVYYLVALGWISSSWFCGAKNDKRQNANFTGFNLSLDALPTNKKSLPLDV